MRILVGGRDPGVVMDVKPKLSWKQNYDLL